MKKVLLTGATGYIGNFAIKHLLAHGYVVHAVSSRLPDARFSAMEGDIEWHQADLLSREATASLLRSIRPTHLLHFAWFVEHGKFWNAKKNADWLEASLHLAERFGENGGQRFVAAGTCAEYDWTAPGPFSENKTPLLPQTAYGEAKRALGIELEKLAAKLDFSFASGRIFFPFGMDEPPARLIPSVIRALLQNREAETSHGEQVRDFIYVREVAEAFAALVDSGVIGPVNIGSGKGVKIKEVVNAIGEIIGKPELLRIGALAAAPNEPASIVADVTRLRDDVGFESREDLAGALVKTINWWKEHL
jgi:nucleoside-diphosphate-sugar epimerase